jgi:hypothetical protein
MAPPTTFYSVTLHHLAPGATAAGLGYPEEQMPNVTATQLAELLQSLSVIAGSMTIYEPSSPEIRIKTEREILVVRTRYRRLCLVGRESSLRGEEHTVARIMAAVSGVEEPEIEFVPVRPSERPAAPAPVGTRAYASASAGGIPEWFKITVLSILIVACLGTGVWLLVKPPKGLAPNFKYMPPAESTALLARAAGEYRTGTAAGDRRLIISADGTLQIAKYGAAQVIAEESVRTIRGAFKDGKPGLATSDPYLIEVPDADTVIMFSQAYKRVLQ